MASSKLSEVREISLLELDLISNLPEDVRQKILTYLPIRVAGRTSVLSRRWRYIWASIPELTVVDTESISNLEKFVDAILLLHNGPIRKFDLYTHKPCHAAFDRWIVNLSRNGIRELTLDLSSLYGNYMMHSKFFSSYELNYVNLTFCSFKVPDWFTGFKLLHTLELNFLDISDGEIQKLISSCPLLEKLKLNCVRYSVIALNIDAPNLLSLDIYGTFTDLKLCAPKLCFLCLVLEYDDENNTSKNLEQVIRNLPELDSLELGRFFLEYLGVGPLREGFSLTFNSLKYLNIDLGFETEKEALFVLALFQGAPHLQTLHIDVDSDERPTLKFWETVDRKGDLFRHLRKVKITDFIVADTILAFVKFILESAPQLLSLTIKENRGFKEYDGTIVLKQLLLFRRASPNAQIIFK